MSASKDKFQKVADRLPEYIAYQFGAAGVQFRLVDTSALEFLEPDVDRDLIEDTPEPGYYWRGTQEVTPLWLEVLDQVAPFNVAECRGPFDTPEEVIQDAVEALKLQTTLQ